MATVAPSQFSSRNVLVIVLVSLAIIVFFLIFRGSEGANGLLKVRAPPLTWNVTAGLVNDPTTWGDDIPMFYIFRLGGETDEMQFKNECAAELDQTYCNYLFSSPRRVTSQAEAKIFLVPIFPSMVDAQKELQKNIALLYREQYFMKFRGSDFLFLCYLGECSSARERVLDGLNIAVRAMWVSRGQGKAWPCEGRRILVGVDQKGGRLITSWSAESKRLLYILRKAGRLIYGRNRWLCDFEENWEVKRSDIVGYGMVVYISQISLKDRVMYCGVPKVGSSVSVLLMRRMNNMINWKTIDDAQIRNFDAGIYWRLHDQLSTYRLFDDASWVKGALVRNPVTRLLSAYRSKVEQLREYGRLPGNHGLKPGVDPPPSFSRFLEIVVAFDNAGRMHDIDLHFRPQSILCGFRYLPYDFVGRYEDRERDMYDFLVSLELWDKLGSTGWGPNGTDSLFASDEKLTLRQNLKPVTHADSKAVLRTYYTKELLEIVFGLYKEDFVRFGYSMNVDDYI